jgi:outer membrane receptor for ferrienterochelin and colicins
MKKRSLFFRTSSLILFSIFPFVLAGPAGAEEGYTLQILDPNGMPVAGARVQVEGTDVAVQTDANGKARIGVVPGTYGIGISAEGFEPLAQELRIGADQAVDQPIRMSLAFTTDDVVVTGTMAGRLLDDTPVKTELVTRQDIERKTALSLAGALSQVEGVRVESNCQNCGFTGVRINGLDNKYTQILLDGMPMVSGLALVYGIEQIPQEMIERVEVVKGGGSALYGGNAVAGVINVISRRPTRNRASVSGNYLLLDMDQPWLNLSASGSVVNKEKDMGAFVFGGMQYRNPWDANDDGFSEIGQLRLLDTGANVFIDPIDDGTLRINTHFIQEKRRGGDSFDKPELQAEIAESINTRRYGADLRWKHWLSSSLNYEVNYGFAYTERDSYYGAGMDPNAYGFTKNPVHVVRGMLNNNFSEMGRYGSLLLTAGLQYDYEELEDTFPGYDRFTDVDYTDFGGFVQADWLVNDWLEPIVGVRVDKHSEIDDPIASPRLALKIKPTERVTLRTAASTGFRAPQIFDEDLHITIVGGEPALIENSPDLKEESSYSFSQEVGTDWDLPDFGTFRFAVTGFYTRINDTFTFEEIESPDALVLRRINQGHTEVYGAEFQIGLAYRDWLTADFGWTLENAKRSEPDPIFNSDDVFRTPDAYGYLATVIRPMERLEIVNSLELTGPMKVEHFAGFIPEDKLEESDWFYVWNAKVSYNFDLKHNRNLRLYVGVDNILDSFQDDFDQGPDRDAGYVYGPMMPRTFVTGFKFGI